MRLGCFLGTHSRYVMLRSPYRLEAVPECNRQSERDHHRRDVVRIDDSAEHQQIEDATDEAHDQHAHGHRENEIEFQGDVEEVSEVGTGYGRLDVSEVCELEDGEGQAEPDGNQADLRRGDQAVDDHLHEVHGVRLFQS